MTYDELRKAVLSIAQEVAEWHQDNPYPEHEKDLRGYDEARADMQDDTTYAITQLAKEIA